MRIKYSQHPANVKRQWGNEPNTPLKQIPVQFEKSWRKEVKLGINKIIKRQIAEAKELSNHKIRDNREILKDATIKNDRREFEAIGNIYEDNLIK